MTVWDDFSVSLSNKREEFKNASKRILKSNLSTNPVTVERNFALITDKFNQYCSYIASFYSIFDDTQKKLIDCDYTKQRDKFVRVLGKINYSGVVSNTFSSEIRLEDFRPVSLPVIFEDLNIKENKICSLPAKMSQVSVPEFLRTASSILDKYDGSPSTLESFLTNVSLIKELAGSKHVNLAFTFVKGRLEGRALDALENAKTINELEENLKIKIKPESSAILEARLSVLRLEKGKLSEFSKEVEKLADQLKRSLTVSGVPSKIAQEMVTNKVTELCKKSADSEYIRTIMAAGRFETPKEAITKFALEQTEQTKNSQVLAMYHQEERGPIRGYNNQRFSNYRGRFGGQNRNRGFNNRGGRGHFNNRVRVVEAENLDLPAEAAGYQN